MRLTGFLNQKRLRDYPRLFLTAMILVMAFNVILGEGWMGAVKQIIGCDFIVLYSGGQLYKEDITRLYDFQYQGDLQKKLISPTPFWGIMPFTYPPYAAMALSPFSIFKLPFAFAIWIFLTLAATVLSAFWLHRFLTPGWLKQAGLTFSQLLILIFSFFPFVEGFQVGQNHGFTLLLITGIVIFTLTEKWYLAGFMAGLMIYKPQFIIGFLILWIVWRKYKPLAAFIITGLSWTGVFILKHGFVPIQAYLSSIPVILRMTFLQGEYLEVTPYGLLTSILPSSWWQGILVFSQVLTIILGFGLGYYAFIRRKQPLSNQKPALMLAILYPLLVAPHTLLHDLIILIPLFILWSSIERSRRLLYICISVYLLTLVLPPITHATGIALLGLIPVILAIILNRQSKVEWSTA